ncbi:MAG: PhnD/SsuA/transferrin family substrate-binding protein [Candidatus Krumholzibacteria bacterium]
MKMKDKIKPFDVSILSTYMGRSLTLVVTVAVVGITVSAYLSSGGPQRGTINVCVPAGTSAVSAMRKYEPLRAVLSRETRRPAELVACDDTWPAGCDLYVMPVHTYLRHGEPLGIAAIYEVVSGDEKQNDAVLVARASDAEIDFARLDPGEIAFAGPSSINGFWVQMLSLSRRGFVPPEDAGVLRFEGPDPHGLRVVLGVLYGAYRLGACTQADLSVMTEVGVVRPGELEIVQRDEALPEIVVAAPQRDTDYYLSELRKIEGLLEKADGSVSADAPVGLLNVYGVGGLRPLDPARLEKARQLFELYGNLF